MKLSYFELLSPAPVNIPQVGGILSPTLKDIASIGIQTYQYYLTILHTYMQQYDLLTVNIQSALFLQNLLNFFIQETVVYSAQDNCFLVQENTQTIGSITKELFPQICDVIFQRNCVKTGQEEELSKIKNKKALEIMKKLQKGRAEKSRQAKADQNLELGNILSAVANKSSSLNILNIWDLTVFQLWDCFLRLSNNNIYAIQSMSVAAWGNKDHSFDAAAWFKRIDNTN